MTANLPKRPIGNSAADRYHQKIWDALYALAAPTGRGVMRTTRGVVHLGGGDSSTTLPAPGTIEIPEWTDTGWATGDLVVRSAGNKGPGPWTPADAMTHGRLAGTWVALQNISSGTDPDGPSLDSTKWRCVAPFATELLVLSKAGKGNIQIDVGRDGAALPFITIRETGSGGEFDLDTQLLNGRRLYPVEVQVCVGGVRKKMLVLGSDPYD